MSDPWWFRNRRFTEQVDQLDAVGRAAVIAAVGHETRWYRWVALSGFVAIGLFAITVAIHDYFSATVSSGDWRSRCSFLWVMPAIYVGMRERIDLVTHRKVRAYEQQNLRTEIATLLATRPS